MGVQTVRVPLSREEAVRRLAELPGRLADGDPLGDAVLTAAGCRTLDLLAERFDALSVPGGIYAATGETWADNAPATVKKKLAANRKGRRAATAGKRQKPPPTSAKGYLIGVDSGAMRDALEPGDDGPSGNPRQVFRLERGAIVVGVETPPDYPERFAAGVPDRQPARPLVPAEWPDEWNDAIGDTVGDAVGQAVVGLLTAG